MSLENLVGVSLEKITPARQTVQRLLGGASRHIADAKVARVSAETRFASAYTAIRMLADVGLHARGYRTLTSRPGHHQAAIQTLVHTLGVDNAVVIRLDALRRRCLAPSCRASLTARPTIGVGYLRGPTAC